MDLADVLAALDALNDALPAEGAVVYARSFEGEMLQVAGDVRRLTGHEAADLRGGPERWWSRVHREDRDAARAASRDLRPGESVTVEYRLMRPSGGESWVRDVMLALPEEGGGGIAGTLVGVGLERSFRAQIAALEARIWESQRLESLGALSGSVAHDFNNLLTTILSSAQLLDSQNEELSREARRDLHLIQDAARRGAGLVRQILHFASRRPAEPGPLDVNDVVSGLEPILRRRIGSDVVLDVRYGSALPVITGDTARLEQVLLNLVVNAHEATPAGGDIKVETAFERVEEPLLVEGESSPLPTGSYVRISVRDSGTGIPLAARARIFEPFFSTKRSRGGSGLGLSTVQRVVHAQGGGIRIETDPGRGTCFKVYLPARPSAVPAELRAATLAEPRGGFRILVVEDDEGVRSLLERMLVRDGHAVVGAESATEAIRSFDRARPPFDVLLADVVLVGRSGPDVVKALRRRAPDLAVVYVSGMGHDSARARGVDSREIFLAKPFSEAELRDALARARERSRRDEGDQASHA
ncbi:MAG: response regulator [Gemmatimonadetes bacterium]|nr:response regulator [Gemmatimonadota bacterium]